MFFVKKGVPIPAKKFPFEVYPFSSMDIGDMFEVEREGRARVAAAASKYGTRNGKRFCTKKIDDAGENYGVWRIK